MLSSERCLDSKNQYSEYIQFYTTFLLSYKSSNSARNLQFLKKKTNLKRKPFCARLLLILFVLIYVVIVVVGQWTMLQGIGLAVISKQ